MQPGDLILTATRKYKVSSECLGGTHQENVVGLVCADGYLMPNGDDGKALEAMYVPVNMIVGMIQAGVIEHYVPATRVA